MARVVSPVLYEVRAITLCDAVTAVFSANEDAEQTPLSARRRATLADVPLSYFVDLRRTGIDVVYLLGVWTTGQAGLQHSIEKLGPDHADTAVSSPFAITQYHVAPELGGDEALRGFKTVANTAGLRVMVDFVPNHLAIDHRWTSEKPWLLVQGSDADAARHPDRYFKFSVPSSAASSDAPTATTEAATTAPQTSAQSAAGASVWLAHGRDPHSGGWRDTVQLNYRHPQLRALMKSILLWCVGGGAGESSWVP